MGLATPAPVWHGFAQAAESSNNIAGFIALYPAGFSGMGKRTFATLSLCAKYNSMTDVAYYLSFALNMLLAACAYFVVRGSVKSKRIDAARGKLVYSVAVIAGGVLSGVVLFHAMVGLFRLLGHPASYGHGEVIIAAVVFNVLLSLLLSVVGRIVLGWRPFQWR